MRIASWVVVACCALAAIGVFFPAIEARPELTGRVQRIARRTSLSLYQAAADRELARHLLAVYRASHGQKVGTKLIDDLEPHTHGHAKDALDDARDAMDTLGGISDAQAKTIGTALAAAIWSFLAIAILIALLALAQAVGGIYGRGRSVLILVLSVIACAAAIAMWIACKQVVFEINDEVSYAVAELGSGAWMIPIGGAGMLAGAVALLTQLRQPRASQR
ncbi:MAG TPA: hypothetical protein VGG74_10790 [Kofleriaceae bacterium]|jgi:hypothetical protein